jgi:hypothetical protein
MSLTPRQLEVLGLSARRRSAKQIARDLGISENRVNQHIAALKRQFGVNDLAGLHDAYERIKDLCRETSSRNLQVPVSSESRQDPVGAYPDRISVSDAMPLRHPAPWDSDILRVGPGALDGPGADLLRIAAIILVSLGLPALLVLGLTARWAITAATASAP